MPSKETSKQHEDLKPQHYPHIYLLLLLLLLVEDLHEYGQLPEGVPALALQGLPLENSAADLDQLAVAVKTLVQPLFLRDVNAYAGRRRVDVGPDDGSEILQDLTKNKTNTLPDIVRYLSTRFRR